MVRTETLLSEVKERYEAQLKEKDRLIDTLAEQIEWLRNQLGRPMLGVSGLNPTQQAPALESIPLYLTEDEEELEAMRQAGLIEPEAYRATLELLQTAEQAPLPME